MVFLRVLRFSSPGDVYGNCRNTQNGCFTNGFPSFWVCRGPNSGGGIPEMYSFTKGFQVFAYFGTFMEILGSCQMLVLLTVFHYFEYAGDQFQGGGIPELYSFTKGF